MLDTFRKIGQSGAQWSRRHWRGLIVIVVIIMGLWLNNTSLFMPRQHPRILAHRGLAQTFDYSKVGNDTNTAAIMDKPEHPYLENTIPSMRAAFDHGADVVELDLKLTKDQQLAVFHDSTLEYRTEAKGEIGNYTMAELKQLDIGYGYTADGGKTFPFRGKGVGLMPTLDEVLAAFPHKDLLLHVKDGNRQTYEVLWGKLRAMDPERFKQMTVYGNDDGIAWLRQQSATLRLCSKAMMKAGLLRYVAVGWTGYVPHELHNMELHIPRRYAPLLWGWPGKFVDRMAAVNTRVMLVEGDGQWSAGFDTEESVTQIPPQFGGYVWTNRIDRVQPVLARRR